jgi:hypothetical protein
MEKFALFAFNGDPLCFIHVLLNALDLSEKGHAVSLVIEGAATRLIPELDRPDHPLHALYRRARESVLLLGACRACAQKMGTLESAREQGLKILDDMSGHAGLAPFVTQGCRIVTF